MAVITYKTPEEAELMRKANRLAADTLDMITPFVKAGVTTLELDKKCEEFIRDHGATPAPLREGFPKATCISPNEVICHGIPGDTKNDILNPGDSLNIDISVVKDDYCGDTSKMFYVPNEDGSAPKNEKLVKKLIHVTRECLFKGIQTIKPGAFTGDIGHVIQEHAESQGFSVVREFCGHGIGKTLHEGPQILHYGKPGTGEQLTAGLCFTIEPMINFGSRKIKHKKDGWTVVTKDRSLSVQWEHTMLVTESGYEILSLRADERKAFENNGIDGILNETNQY